MNLNDVAMVGAIPYAIQNHIVLPKDDHKAILEIVKALVFECKKRKIAMTGGETSIHSDAQSMDISVTVSAFIDTPRQNLCNVGDVLIGLPSSGLHSNGITKVRELFGNKQRQEFTEPTTIYLDTVLTILKKHKVNGMMHITGGAFTKLRDILDKADAHILQPRKLMPQEIFKEIYSKGLSNKVMYSTFNCGVGFIFSVPKSETTPILSRLPSATIIGEVVAGTGQIKIQSAFNGKSFVL